MSQDLEKTELPTIVVIDFPNAGGNSFSKPTFQWILEGCNNIASKRSSRVLLKFVFANFLSVPQGNLIWLSQACRDHGYFLVQCDHVRSGNGERRKETVDVRILRFLSKMGWLSTQPCLFLLASADRDYADAYPDLRDMGHQVELILRPDQEGRTGELTERVHFLPEKPSAPAKSPKPLIKPSSSRYPEGFVRALETHLRHLDHASDQRRSVKIRKHLRQILGLDEKEAQRYFDRARTGRKGANPLIRRSTMEGKKNLYFLTEEEEEKRQAPRMKKARPTPARGHRQAPPPVEVVEAPPSSRSPAKAIADEVLKGTVQRYLDDLGPNDHARKQGHLTRHVASALGVPRRQAKAWVSRALDLGWIDKDPDDPEKRLRSAPSETTDS